MIRKSFLLFALVGLSCTSDDVIRAEKTNFYNIYKNIIVSERSNDPKIVKNKKKVYDRDWLSKFSQPIVLLSSQDEKTGASLVALGNYNNRLTWVSSDGISVSFENGILIATRGYSQDLIEARHDDLNSLLTSSSVTRSKTYRYINGENEYI